MQEDWQQKIKEIQKETGQVLEKLKHRERLTSQEVRMLQRELARLYEDLQDANFKAEQGRIFRKDTFTVRSGPA